MEKMKRNQPKESHSWWSNSHISRKNSKWLAESLAEMDQSVGQMLKLIEEEGDSFEHKADMYYAKRPELISHVENFQQMYRALAERYEQETGGLRKKVKSKVKSLAGGFDLGFGGSSDHSKNSDDNSQSSSSSESDVDDLSEANFDGDSSLLLHQRILELENELSLVKDKLEIQEDSDHLDLKSKVSELEEKLSVANVKLHDSEAQLSDVQKKLEETAASLAAENAELSLEKSKVYRLEEQVSLLHDEILGYKLKIEQLKGAAEAATTELQNHLLQHNDQIEQCKNELTFAEETFLLEKSSFETRIADLDDLNALLNAEVDKYAKDTLSLNDKVSDLEHIIHVLKASCSSSMEKLLQEKSTLEAEISILSHSKGSLEAEVMTLTGQISQLEDEMILANEEHVKCINELNQNINALKLNIDEVTSEKLELAAKLSVLVNDLKSRDDKIYQVDQHLNELHLEHVNMITAMEASRRSISELQVRVKELEEEVEKQKAAVSESGEGKREAIRQLCFSLEYYRNEYNELLQRWHLNRHIQKDHSVC